MVTRHDTINKEFEDYEILLAKLPKMVDNLGLCSLEELFTYIDLLYKFAYPSQSITDYKVLLSNEIDKRISLVNGA